MVRQKKEPTLPPLTNPMTDRQESFKIRFKKEEMPDDADLTAALRGLGKIDETINSVNEVREKIMSDPTLNEAAKRAEYLRYAKKKQDELQFNIENVSRIVDRRTTEISDTINRPINDEAGGRDASDIRKYVAKLDKSDRVPFIKARIDEGHWESASAALGSKFFLAGLSPEMHGTLMKYYREKRFSDLMKVNSGFDKIGTSLMKKLDITSRFIKKLQTKDTNAALESRKAREDAMKV